MCLLGPFTVEGKLQAPVPVGKARRTLAVLAERAGEFVSAGALVDALWDASPPDHAERNLAALISRLRRALGRDSIDGNASGYRLVTDHVSVDLNEAIEYVRTAERELRSGRFALASTSAERAAELLGSDITLAGERDDLWVEQLRQTVARWLRRARLCWGAAALELGAPDVAVQAAEAALQADPLDEEACRTLMTGYQQAGRSGAALIAYQRLRQALSEQLGSDPSPATEAVYVSVLRSQQSPAVSRSRPGQPVPAEQEPLVGRAEQLDALRRLWDSAAVGSPALAVITGEAGIGKTALVTRFAEDPRRTGALVVAVGCFEAERSLYLQPLAQAVRVIMRRLPPAEVRALAGTRVGTLAQLVPELTDVAGPVSYERASPELEHGRSLDALAGFFAGLSARRPVLLIVEDCQHAGQSTVEALHLIVSQWAGSRMMLVLTERTSEDEPVTGQLRDVASGWIELGPLGPGEVAVLVRQSGLAYDVGQLNSWTGGSPLFVTELLRHPAPATAPAAGGEPVIVPSSLHEAVAERIAHCGEPTAELLAQGGVLGTAFSLDEVARLSGIDVEDCARRAARALRARLLLADGGSFRFANDIVRHVAYESAPEPVRVSRHRRAADMAADHPEAAARHFAAAGDWPPAAQAWLAAAQTAHQAFANNEAVELLGHALASAQRAGEPAQVIEVLLRRGRAYSELGRYEDARADHQAALELARNENDSVLEARALEQLGWTALFARDAPHAVDFAEQATELAESAAAAPGALPTAALLLGRVRHWDGEYAGAAAAYEKVLSSEPDETTTALALAYRGALLQHQDRFAEARAVLARAAVLCRRTGEFRPMLQTLFFTALARGDTGDFGGALRALDNARRLIDAENVSFYRAGIETTTSWIWQELGHLRRAREHAEHAVELARHGGGALELEQELHALLAVADCDLLLGNEQSAAAAVEAAAPMLNQSLPFRPRAVMRWMEMRSRWQPELAEELLAQARRYSSRKYLALALHRLGRAEEARAAAASTRSDLLLAQLGTPGERRAAMDRIATALPAELRTAFVTAGRLSVPPPRTH